MPAPAEAAQIGEFSYFYTDSEPADAAGAIARHDAMHSRGEMVESLQVAVGEVVLSADDIAVIEDFRDSRYGTRLREGKGEFKHGLPRAVRDALRELHDSHWEVVALDAERADLGRPQSQQVMAGFYAFADWEAWHVDGEESTPGFRWTVTPHDLGSTRHAQGKSGTYQMHGGFYELNARYMPGRNPGLTVVTFKPGTVVRHELTTAVHASPEGNGGRSLSQITRYLR